MAGSSWAWASDILTRRLTFAAIFVFEALLFALLPGLSGTIELTATVFLILVCFGGSVGTKPTFVTDCFGPRNVGAIYGAMLTAWGLGTVFGASLLTAIHERFGGYGVALRVLAGIALLSAVSSVDDTPASAVDRRRRPVSARNIRGPPECLARETE